MSFADAMSWTRIAPGHTVYLKGGTYSGDYVCRRNGTAAQPITYRAAAGERVIIDGSLTIEGAHTRWIGIEKCLSGGTRYTEGGGSAPSIVAGGLTVNGSGTKLINCIIHNQVDNGIGWWSPASGGELYGCIIFDNGWSAPDRGHGHALYTQNLSTNSIKTMKHCVLAQQFGMSNSNLSLYGTGATGLEGYRLSESVFIGGRQLIGGDAPINDIEVDDCHAYGNAFELGWHDDGHINTIIRRLRMKGEFAPLFMRAFTLQDSLIVTDGGDVQVIYSQEPAENFVGYTLSGNAYHNRGENLKPFQVETVGTFTFDEWKARYSCDADSTYSTDLPASNSIHVYPNEYDEDRGMIVVWNWLSSDSASVDVSTVLDAGDSYRLRQVTDYFGDVATGTVALDGTITIDMQAASHSVSTPDGWETPLMDVTFPVFGCFVVEKAA